MSKLSLSSNSLETISFNFFYLWRVVRFPITRSVEKANTCSSSIKVYVIASTPGWRILANPIAYFLAVLITSSLSDDFNDLFSIAKIVTEAEVLCRVPWNAFHILLAPTPTVGYPAIVYPFKSWFPIVSDDLNYNIR